MYRNQYWLLIINFVWVFLAICFSIIHKSEKLLQFIDKLHSFLIIHISSPSQTGWLLLRMTIFCLNVCICFTMLHFVGLFRFRRLIVHCLRWLGMRGENYMFEQRRRIEYITKTLWNVWIFSSNNVVVTSCHISTCFEISLSLQHQMMCYGSIRSPVMVLWAVYNSVPYVSMLLKLNFRLQLCMNEMVFHLIANEKLRKDLGNRVEIFEIFSLASRSTWSSNLVSFFIYELILKFLVCSVLLNHRRHASSFSFVCFH